MKRVHSDADAPSSAKGLPGSGSAEGVMRAAAASMMRSHDLAEWAAMGANSTAESPAGSLTLSKLSRLLESLPPRETLVVSDLFPGFSVCKTPRENLTLVHTSKWPALEAALNRELPLEQRGNPLFAVCPVRIDPDPHDDKLTADWRSKERARIMALIADALAAIPAEPRNDGPTLAKAEGPSEQ